VQRCSALITRTTRSTSVARAKALRRAEVHAKRPFLQRIMRGSGGAGRMSRGFVWVAATSERTQAPSVCSLHGRFCGDRALPLSWLRHGRSFARFNRARLKRALRPRWDGGPAHGQEALLLASVGFSSMVLPKSSPRREPIAEAITNGSAAHKPGRAAAPVCGAWH
jgi:hypothetical protein